VFEERQRQIVGFSATSEGTNLVEQKLTQKLSKLGRITRAHSYWRFIENLTHVLHHMLLILKGCVAVHTALTADSCTAQYLLGCFLYNTTQKEIYS
jgi:hypothetical protein